MPFDHWLDPQGEAHGCFGAGDEQKFLPNYHGDLNAMHEAEKVLVSWDDPQNAGHYVWKDSYGAYVGWLAKLTGGLYFHPKADSGEFRKLISATAAQRAEAFLRTLNLW